MQYKKSFSRFADFYQMGNMLVNALFCQMVLRKQHSQTLVERGPQKHRNEREKRRRFLRLGFRVVSVRSGIKDQTPVPPNPQPVAQTHDRATGQASRRL